jgi:ABC-2 type transport system ATP-binding protein
VDAIVVEDLRKRYKDVQALDSVSFAVREGEVFGLLCPNGAGKSTTVRVLATLTKPDGGRAFVAGHDVTSEPNRVRRAIGYVAQNSGVDRDGTGRENLVLQGRIHGLHGRELRARVDELLELVGLTDAADRLVRGYSGGMKRRLDIGIGLVHRPRVVFLDEPTTGLDPEARAAMWGELERLAERERLTILLTTHYLEEADQLADRLAIVSRGTVVVEGTPRELKQRLHGDAVAIELEDGRVLEVGPGDAAVLREGERTVWRVHETLRKVYQLYYAA